MDMGSYFYFNLYQYVKFSWMIKQKYVVFMLIVLPISESVSLEKEWRPEAGDQGTH